MSPDTARPDKLPPAVARAAAQFADGTLRDAELAGGGYIHDSWRVTVEGGGRETRLLLQRLNTRIFTAPHLVMENIVHVSRHLAAEDGDHRKSLTLLEARDGHHHWVDDAAGWWRAFRLIERAAAKDRAESAHDARETGRAFGRFHARMATYAGPPLHETIQHFHDTPWRVDELAEAARLDTAGRVASAQDAVDAILAQRPRAGLLRDLAAAGRMPMRIAHNDAKIGNVLFDEASGEALCVVDLDTVMPGLLLHDFGDMIRSTAATGAEDEPDPAKAGMSVALYTAILDGFLEQAGAMLAPAEREHLADAAQLITLEQAARFLSDYLNGDRYYKVDRPAQNLDRAKAQLAVYRDLLAHDAELRRAAQ